MEGTINMSDVQEQGEFSLITEGEYKARITEISCGYSKNGDPMMKLKMTIETSGEFEELPIWDNILIPNLDSPAIKILGRTKHFLHCLGEPYEDDIEWNSDNWQDKLVIIKVEHEAPNDFHKYIKAVVGGYILDEETKDDKTIPF